MWVIIIIITFYTSDDECLGYMYQIHNIFVIDLFNNRLEKYFDEFSFSTKSYQNIWKINFIPLVALFFLQNYNKFLVK